MQAAGSSYTLVTIIALWQIFKKAGYKEWYALIPIWNVYIYCLIITNSGWSLLILFIPFINIFYFIYLLFRLSYLFGHSFLFGLGLLFLYPIFILILAFGNSKYRCI